MKNLKNNVYKGVRGFTLIEAVIATMIAALITTSAIASFHYAQNKNFDEKRRWSAFSVAQQHIELLSSARPTIDALRDLVNDGLDEDLLGGPLDENCSAGVDGKLSADMKVNAAGEIDPQGIYQLCWKVTDSIVNPGLKNLRVLVGYQIRHIREDQSTKIKTMEEEWKYVLLQKIF